MANRTLLWAVLALLVTACAADEEGSTEPVGSTEFAQTSKALRNIASHLEVVATEGEVVADDCGRQIESVNDTLTWMSSQLPNTTLDESGDFFRSAAKAVAACNTYLSVRAVRGFSSHCRMFLDFGKGVEY